MAPQRPRWTILQGVTEFDRRNAVLRLNLKARAPEMSGVIMSLKRFRLMHQHENDIEAIAYRFDAAATLTAQQVSAVEHCYCNAQSTRIGALDVLSRTQTELQKEISADPFYLTSSLADLQEGLEVYKQMVAMMEAAITRLSASGETLTSRTTSNVYTALV